jgi:hypothetical protein
MHSTTQPGTTAFSSAGNQAILELDSYDAQTDTGTGHLFPIFFVDFYTKPRLSCYANLL